MFKIIKWPIIYMVVQFILIFLLAFYFVYTNENLELFSNYLSSMQIYLVIVLAIIFIPILMKQYKKLNLEQNKIDSNSIILLIGIGIFLSLFYNILIFYINKLIPFTNLYGNNEKIFITLLSTGLIGPIIEEYMFRGLVYNEALKKYSNIKSILITTLIFALFHSSMAQMIYAVIIGLILIWVYEKYKNIKVPIILHMACNITTTLFMSFLIKDYLTINFIIFILSIVCLFTIIKVLKNN